MLSAELKQKLETLPTQAGCYVMKDKAGDVVYVGKAVNLRARVGQYFQERSSDTRAFIPFLEDLLSDVEVMITPSEKDAVLLENELIKKYRPRFNVKLRDDKNFISLRLSNTHPYPRLEVVRRVRKDGARYFGPFASASSIRETLSIVNRHFQLRTCTDSVMANRRRPCLQYQIKRCPAPCVYNVPQEEYRWSVEEVALFLEGKADELTGQLQTRMKDAASKLEYERAAQLRDQLHAIERSLEKQRTVLGELLDQDVLGFHREGPALEIHLLFFRNGRLTGGRSFGFSKQEFPTEELLSSFLDQYYESGALIPKELLLPMHLSDAEMREVWLSEKKGERVRVHVPERGEKVRLVEMAMENARQSYEEQNLPDLLVVDGGKGQLNVARAALKEVGLTLQGVPLAGLAKSRVLEDEERFAARQGFRVAEAWAEKAGPEPVVPQIAGEAGTAPSAPPAPPPSRRSRRSKDSTSSSRSACSGSSRRSRPRWRRARRPKAARRWTVERLPKRDRTTARCSATARTWRSTPPRRSSTRSRRKRRRRPSRSTRNPRRHSDRAQLFFLARTGYLSCKVVPRRTGSERTEKDEALPEDHPRHRSRRHRIADDGRRHRGGDDAGCGCGDGHGRHPQGISRVRR